MRIGVVGHGVVGRRVVSNLFDRPEVARILLITSRQTLAGQVKVTLTDERTVRDEADVVVLATPDPQHEAARVYLEAGCAVVTTSDDAADVGSLLALERLAARRGRPFVVGAAASPGLTGLLARLAADELDTVDEIHVTFHGTGGPACARQHHAALGSLSRVWYDGTWQERPGGTGRELCWFPDPVGAHDCYRAALPDPLLLHRAFPEATRVNGADDGDSARPADGAAPDAAPTAPGGVGGERAGRGAGPGRRGAGRGAPRGRRAARDRGRRGGGRGGHRGRPGRAAAGLGGAGTAAGADSAAAAGRRRGRHRRPPLRRHRQHDELVS